VISSLAQHSYTNRPSPHPHAKAALSLQPAVAGGDGDQLPLLSLLGHRAGLGGTATEGLAARWVARGCVSDGCGETRRESRPPADSVARQCLLTAPFQPTAPNTPEPLTNPIQSKPTQTKSNRTGGLLKVPRGTLFRPRFYRYLFASNLLLRFSWAHRLLGDLEAHNAALLAVALLEVVRRYQWSFVRFEIEMRQLGLAVPSLRTGGGSDGEGEEEEEEEEGGGRSAVRAERSKGAALGMRLLSSTADVSPAVGGDEGEVRGLRRGGSWGDWLDGTSFGGSAMMMLGAGGSISARVHAAALWARRGGGSRSGGGVGSSGGGAVAAAAMQQRHRRRDRADKGRSRSGTGGGGSVGDVESGVTTPARGSSGSSGSSGSEDEGVGGRAAASLGRAGAEVGFTHVQERHPHPHHQQQEHPPP